MTDKAIIHIRDRDINLRSVEGIDGYTRKVIIEANELEISDGYHTMGELYDHRHALFIALCKALLNDGTRPIDVWRSKQHYIGADGKSEGMYPDSFILGIGSKPGSQITYHLPLLYWDETDFAETLEHAPQWDGHSSLNVIERLEAL